MLVDDGVLRREDGQWRFSGSLSELTLPPTIEALLGARLERLQVDEREVTVRASVIGQEFWRGAASELLPDPLRPELDRLLAALLGRQFLRPGSDTSFAGEPAFGFHHILLRDVAYQTLLKELRAELHERFASWLERRAGARLAEYEEIVGYHLEQAYRYHSELGPLDEQGRNLGERAAERLGSAGARALDRDDARAAVRLLERAVDALGEQSRPRPGLLLRLGEALDAAGRLDRAEEVLDEAAISARSAGERSVETHAQLRLSGLQLWIAPQPLYEEATREAERALAVFEELGEDRGLSDAWRQLAEITFATGRVAEAAARLERALVHSRRASDEGQEAMIRLHMGDVMLQGAAQSRKSSTTPRPRFGGSRTGGRALLESAALSELSWQKRPRALR